MNYNNLEISYSDSGIIAVTISQQSSTQSSHLPNFTISTPGQRATELKTVIDIMQLPIIAISVIAAVNGLCIGLGIDLIFVTYGLQQRLPNFQFEKSRLEFVQIWNGLLSQVVDGDVVERAIIELGKEISSNEIVAKGQK